MWLAIFWSIMFIGWIVITIFNYKIEKEKGNTQSFIKGVEYGLWIATSFALAVFGFKGLI